MASVAPAHTEPRARRSETDDSSQMLIAKRLVLAAWRDFCEAHGLTDEKLSKRWGVSATTVARIRLGKGARLGEDHVALLPRKLRRIWRRRHDAAARKANGEALLINGGQSPRAVVQVGPIGGRLHAVALSHEGVC